MVHLQPLHAGQSVPACTASLTHHHLRLVRKAAARQASVLLPRSSSHSSSARPGSFSRIVATSEFWYEEEDDFDSLTDALKPKHVLLVARGGGAQQLQSLRDFLAPTHLNSGFSSTQDKEWAGQLWAGRDKPPFFIKVRARQALDAAAASAPAAAEVWQELLQQNWRVELDYGLGTEVPDSEALLLVAAPEAVAALLAAAAAGGDAPREVAPGSVSWLYVGGAEAGATGGWAALRAEVRWASRLPGPGEMLSPLDS